MAVVPMQKIRLCIHDSVATETLGIVQDMGIMEFTQVQNSDKLSQREKKTFEFNYVSGRLDFAVEFLSRYETNGSKLRRMIEGTRVHTSSEDIEKVAKNFYYNEIIDVLQNTQEKLNTANDKIKKLKKEKKLLEKWIDLDMPLGQDFITQATKTLFLEQKSEVEEKEQKSELQEFLHKKKIQFEWLPVGDLGRGLLTYLHESEQDVLKIVAQANLEVIDISKRRGTPKEEVERVSRAIQNTQKRIQDLEQKITELLPNLSKLKMLSDYMHWKKQKHNVLTSAKTTKAVLVYEGWCHKEKLEELKKRIEKVTSHYSLSKIKPQKEEKTPVVIQNNATIRPFETITRLYGLPAYKEFDPTIFLAGFFFLFFGLCLTDVFYGIFIFAITAAVLYFYRVPEGSKPLIKLLMFGGIASSVIGLFFGGYLGISQEHFPAWAVAIQQFDPLANPLPILYLSLGLGFVQILFGILLKIFTKAKNGEMMKGILDDGPWVAFFLFLALFGAQKFGLISGFGDFTTIPLYIIVGVIVITQGREEKTIVKQLFTGIASLYNIVGYFSDILSYSRLLALGLATSALAYAINLIAQIIGDMIPYIGPILAVIILIVGHIFNLVINALGAFIHSARLQFVEFFGKFIGGGGCPLEPFEREERYVVLQQKKR